MFQFGGFPSHTYLIQYTIYDSSSYVFPHSEICGSKLICSSPQLIAACHVLHRLPMPRHSPYALLRLNYFCILISIYFRFSLCLNCCVFILAVKRHFFIMPSFWQNCFFLPLLRKNLISLQDLSCFDFLVFSLYFVCHVLLILLFGFQ